MALRRVHRDLPPPDTSFLIRRVLKRAGLSPERPLYAGHWGRHLLYVLPVAAGEFPGFLEDVAHEINALLSKHHSPVRVLVVTRAESLEALARTPLPGESA